MNAIRNIRNVLFVLTLAALAWGYQTMFLHHAPDVFRSPEEDLSYGWFVPLFSLYVVWTERKAIRAAVGSVSLIGMLASLVPFALGFLGIRGSQVRLEIVGFAFSLVTLVWAFYGRRAAARVLFPAAFLLFAMPLTTYLDTVTVHLRMFVVTVAETVLRLFGADVVRNGTMLASESGSFAIDVATPCSGLRSLFALMALTAGYAYFNLGTWKARGVLFALSVPIAILGNVVRILTIAAVGICCSSEFATGFYHDYSGYVVFVVAIALVMWTAGRIARLEKSVGRERRDCREAIGNPGRAAVVALAVFAGLVAGMMSYQAKTPETVLMPAPEVKFPIIAGMVSERVEVPSEELAVLPADTIIERRLYKDTRGAPYLVTVVVGGRSKSSVHRPELCLPGQGFEISERYPLTAGGAPWTAMRLSRRGVGVATFAYTFDNRLGTRTASHLKRIAVDVWDRSVRGRIDRWTMITVAAAVGDADLGRFLAQIKEAVK